MKRKCLAILILSFAVLVSGCMMSREAAMEMKKPAAEPVNVSYDYPWEKVYDAYAYVLDNSAMDPIAIRAESQFSHVKFLVKEKRILIIVYDIPVASYRDIELAINFIPETDKKTKVNIVKGTSVMRKYFKDQDDAVKQLLDEVGFVLTTGGKGYYDYTTANSEKYYKEKSAERRDRRHNWNDPVR